VKYRPVVISTAQICPYRAAAARKNLPRTAFLGLILWNSQWGEITSIPKEVIGMATTCNNQVSSSAKDHSEWSVVIGIEAHGAQRWDVTGGDGDGGEHGGDAGEGGEIVGRDTVKQAGHEMRNNKRANQVYAGADGGQSEALA
jgi:hypothetical protein